MSNLIRRRNNLTGTRTHSEIEKHVTFHGRLTRREAGRKLREQEASCHLTRYSNTRQLYVLSVINKRPRSRSSLRHFDLEVQKAEETKLYKLKGRRNTKLSTSYTTLLKHYENLSISRHISGIGTGLQNLENQNEEVQQAPPTWQLMLISRHSSFHGPISGAEAKDRLEAAACKHGATYCFLTRYSSPRDRYILAVLKRERDLQEPTFEQFNVLICKGETDQVYCEIENTGEKFKDIFALVLFYKTAPVSPKILNIGSYLDVDSNELVLPEAGHRDFTDHDSQGTGRYSVEYQQSSELEMTSPPHHFHFHFQSVDYQNDEDFGTVLRKLFSENKENTMSYPSLQKLTRMEWQDTHMMRKELKIIDRTSAEWDHIGILLGQENRLDHYRGLHNSIVRCCWRVFQYWIQNNGCQDYPLTWEAVYRLLNDIEHGQLAELMREALMANDITF